jgi:hypothetical protein
MIRAREGEWPPWRVVEHAESFWVQDAHGQTVGWFYFRDHPETARHMGVLERDETDRRSHPPGRGLEGNSRTMSAPGGRREPKVGGGF